MLATLACVLAATAQDGPADESARAALRRLGERMRSVRTFSATVTQSRRTILLKDPLVSSGTLHYRKDPARLVVLIEKPRAARIQLDEETYQVYRPDERRLERLHLGGKGPMTGILDLFQPEAESLEKSFALERLPAADGRLRILLKPKRAETRARIERLEMELAEKDGSLRTIVYTDPDGDVVTLSISDPRFDPELAESVFHLDVPDDTRILDTRMEGKRR